MRESRMSGSVRGVLSNGYLYRDYLSLPWYLSLPVFYRYLSSILMVTLAVKNLCPSCAKQSSLEGQSKLNFHSSLHFPWLPE